MKPHYHNGIDHVLVLALEVALVFHGFRFLAARLATVNGAPGKAGQALGGAFTFGGIG